MWQALPWWGLSWLLGTGLQLQQASVWPLSLSLGISSVAILWLVLTLCRLFSRRAQSMVFKSQAWLYFSVGCAVFLLAMATLHIRCWHQMQDALDPNLERQDLQLVVEVASLPHVTPHGVRFQAQVIHALHSNTRKVVKVPEKIELSWFEWDAPSTMDLPIWQSLQAGDLWQFQVRLKVPHGTMNPGGFDAELYWWEQGVMATGSIRSGKTLEPPRKLGASWHHPVNLLRQHVRANIGSTLRTTDPRTAGLISALVVGDQTSIANADWELFRATGVAHLMSISGLHITMFAWLASLLIQRIWCVSALQGSALCLQVPAPFASSFGGVILALLYALFCGWGLPAQRTVLMLGVLTFLKWRGLRWPWQRSWGFALWAVSVWDPWSLLQASFWLSFVAVGALMLSDQHSPHVRTNLVGQDAKKVQKDSWLAKGASLITALVQSVLSLAREQWVVTVALMPLTILFFGQLSVIGLLANLVAIPWVTLCVTPLAMAGLLWPPIWHLAVWALQPLMGLLTYMAGVSWGVLSFAQAPLVLTLLALLGASVCFQPWPWAVRCWGLMGMLPILLWQPQRPAWGQFDIWALDIGQGNAVLLRTANHAVLYDAGPAWGVESDAGQRVLVPFMARSGVNLNLLMLSHRDADHTGGAASVLTAHPQAELWGSLEAGHPLTELRALQACRAGQTWEWDGVKFEVLHPGLDDHTASASSNSLSCVLRVEASQSDPLTLVESGPVASALLTGDLEAPQEFALLKGQKLKPVDFLLVPHHGSQTSSTLAFVQATRPKWAVVQAGYRNRYGHPAPHVVLRYQQLGVPLAMSPECGAAHWQSSHPQRLDCEREVNRRYWHFIPPEAH